MHTYREAAAQEAAVYKMPEASLAPGKHQRPGKSCIRGGIAQSVRSSSDSPGPSSRPRTPAIAALAEVTGQQKCAILSRNVFWDSFKYLPEEGDAET